MSERDCSTCGMPGCERRSGSIASCAAWEPDDTPTDTERMSDLERAVGTIALHGCNDVSARRDERCSLPCSYQPLCDAVVATLTLLAAYECHGTPERVGALERELTAALPFLCKTGFPPDINFGEEVGDEWTTCGDAWRIYLSHVAAHNAVEETP